MEEELDETEIELEQQKHAVRLLKQQNEYLRKQNEEFISRYGAYFHNRSNETSSHFSSSSYAKGSGFDISGYGNYYGVGQMVSTHTEHEVASNSSSDTETATPTPSVDNISLSQVSYSKQSQSNQGANIQQATSLNTKESSGAGTGGSAADGIRINVDYHTSGIWDNPNTGTIIYKGASISPISPLTPLAGLTNKQTKIILSFSQQREMEDKNIIAESDVMEYGSTTGVGDVDGKGTADKDDGGYDGDGDGDGKEKGKGKDGDAEFPDTPPTISPMHRARSLSVPVCSLCYAYC